MAVGGLQICLNSMLYAEFVQSCTATSNTVTESTSLLGGWKLHVAMLHA
jgi:hypothetical protein